MSVINSVHETPHIISSSGYRALVLAHPHKGPVTVAPVGETPAVRRRKARALVKARKREVASGASFLSTLTTIRHGNFGAGTNQGARAPSRRNMATRVE